MSWQLVVIEELEPRCSHASIGQLYSSSSVDILTQSTNQALSAKWSSYSSNFAIQSPDGSRADWGKCSQDLFICLGEMAYLWAVSKEVCISICCFRSSIIARIIQPLCMATVAQVIAYLKTCVGVSFRSRFIPSFDGNLGHTSWKNEMQNKKIKGLVANYR